MCALSPQICLPLLFSPPLAASLIQDAAAHATFHPAAISWVFRLRPRVVSVAPVSFLRSCIWYWIPIDVADHFNVNLCWWSFPYSSAVTWLCQSGCLASTHRRLAVPEHRSALLRIEMLFCSRDEWTFIGQIALKSRLKVSLSCISWQLESYRKSYVGLWNIKSLLVISAVKSLITAIKIIVINLINLISIKIFIEYS